MTPWAAILMLMAAPAVAQGVARAHYAGPVDWYGHRVLGETGEYDTLAVTLTDGAVLSARWDPPMLFEDTAPRVADLDGDGRAEIIVVETHADQGARLALWTVSDGSLHPLVATPFIGRPFRWLAPSAWGDLDGDGRGEIAYVDRPHLVRRLRVWRFQRDGATATLSPVAEADGVTNHRIGDRAITGGARRCGGGSEIIVMDPNWETILAARLAGDGIVVRDVAPFTGPDSIRAALACR